jgi:hypothetical protein
MRNHYFRRAVFANKYRADSIPEDYEGTFVDWLASKADGIGKFECDL